MRRWLVSLLVLLLPIQFTWAVAAPYCKHETSAGAQHFGHHAHEHKDASKSGPASSTSKTDSKTSVAVDYDCELCHLTTANLEAAATPTVAHACSSNAHSTWEHAWSSRDPDRLDRPNWRAA